MHAWQLFRPATISNAKYVQLPTQEARRDDDDGFEEESLDEKQAPKARTRPRWASFLIALLPSFLQWGHEEKEADGRRLSSTAWLGWCSSFIRVAG
jgi:hypothetical protein